MFFASAQEGTYLQIYQGRGLKQTDVNFAVLLSFVFTKHNLGFFKKYTTYIGEVCM